MLRLAASRGYLSAWRIIYILKSAFSLISRKAQSASQIWRQAVSRSSQSSGVSCPMRFPANSRCLWIFSNFAAGILNAITRNGKTLAGACADIFVFSCRSRHLTKKLKPFIKGDFPSLAPARFSLGLAVGRGLFSPRPHIFFTPLVSGALFRCAREQPPRCDNKTFRFHWLCSSIRRFFARVRCGKV